MALTRRTSATGSPEQSLISFPDLSKPGTAATTATQQAQGDGAMDEEPEQFDVESVLVQVMQDEFEVSVDDDSAFETAELIMRVRNECLRGKFDGGRRVAPAVGGEKGKQGHVHQGGRPGCRPRIGIQTPMTRMEMRTGYRYGRRAENRDKHLVPRKRAAAGRRRWVHNCYQEEEVKGPPWFSESRMKPTAAGVMTGIRVR